MQRSCRQNPHTFLTAAAVVQKQFMISGAMRNQFSSLSVSGLAQWAL